MIYFFCLRIKGKDIRSRAGKGGLMLDNYLEAKKLGDRAYRNALLFRQSPYLESLHDFLKNEDIQGENRLATLEIPV